MKVGSVTMRATGHLQNALKELVELILGNENGTHAEINAPTNPGNAEAKLELMPAEWNAKRRAERKDHGKCHFDNLCILHA